MEKAYASSRKEHLKIQEKVQLFDNQQFQIYEAIIAKNLEQASRLAPMHLDDEQYNVEFFTDLN